VRAFSRALIGFFLTTCFFSSPGSLQARSLITLTDSVVVQGAIIRVDILSDFSPDTVTGTFMEKALPFIRTADGNFYSLAGVDMESKPGAYTLALELHRSGKQPELLRRRVDIRDAEFPVQRLTLPPAKVFPDSAALARIKRESDLRNRKWWQWAAGAFWRGKFIPPLKGEMERFGYRRIINEAQRSPHTGVDISAPEGSPVVAPAAGKVILTGDFFFTGKSVYLDHGLGMIGMFFHCSRIDVAEGDFVEQGQVIGAVGSTGRATGPHLHWGVRWRNDRINPVSLLELNFD